MTVRTRAELEAIFAALPISAQDIRDFLASLTLTAEGGGGVVHTVVVDLTSDQIANLFSSPVELVPSQGAGKVIQVLAGAVQTIPNTIPFAGIGAKIKYAADGVELISNLNPGYSESRIDLLLPGNYGETGGVENGAPLVLVADQDDLSGEILTHSLATGGADYAIGDTFGLTAGSTATGVVDTVDGGGAVLTYHFTDPGSGALVGLVDTFATTGIGTGLQINIDSITPANGTAFVFLQYAVLDIVTGEFVPSDIPTGLTADIVDALEAAAAPDAGNAFLTATDGAAKADRLTAAIADWQPDTEYSPGDIVRATGEGAFWYTTDPGTSGGSEPDWSSPSGGFVADNDINWRFAGLLGIVPLNELPFDPDIVDALDSANAPDAGNPFATMADVDPGAVGEDLLPALDDTYDVGSSALRWAEGHFSDFVEVGVFDGDRATLSPTEFALADLDASRLVLNLTAFSFKNFDGEEQVTFGVAGFQLIDQPGAITRVAVDADNFILKDAAGNIEASFNTGAATLEAIFTLPTSDPANAGQLFTVDDAGLAAALGAGARYVLLSGG